LSAAQGDVRKGDGIVLSYELKKVGEKKPLSKNKFDTLASEDGEDILVPLIEQTASEVFTKLVE
jgi:hypothetical protein